MIKDTCVISNDNAVQFKNNLDNAINLLQKRGLIVEVLYTTIPLPNGAIVYNALVIGKEK